MLVLPFIEERAAEAVNSSQNPTTTTPPPRSVWRKIHLFPVSQETFFTKKKNRNMRKKTKENPLQMLHLYDHFKWLQCYCALFT